MHHLGDKLHIAVHARRTSVTRQAIGKNPLLSYIPVARISDLLLNPGATIDYNGKRITKQCDFRYAGR